MKLDKSAYCGITYALQLLGGKWKPLILWRLFESKARYGELRRYLTGISERVLITQLKQLEVDGLLKRIDYGEIPPRVEYEITELGKSTKKALTDLNTWGNMIRPVQKTLSQI